MVMELIIITLTISIRHHSNTLYTPRLQELTAIIVIRTVAVQLNTVSVSVGNTVIVTSTVNTVSVGTRQHCYCYC